MKFYKLTLAILALAFAAALPTSAVCAQDADEQEAKSDPTVFDVPDGKDVAFYTELLPKIMKEYQLEVQGAKNAEEAKPYLQKLGKALKALYVNTKDAKDDDAKQVSSNAFFITMQVYEATGDLEGLKALREVASDEYKTVIDALLLQVTIQNAAEKKDKAAIKAAIDDYFAKSDDLRVAGSADSIAMMLQEIDPAVAKEFSSRVVEEFSKSDVAVKKQIAERIVGKVRFAELVGNEMKMEGLYLDGKEIDWSSYRGKVVLVDFWATWCGPCLGEIPNVQALYEKYHEAGFDVLGYSVDRDVDALKKFEEERKLPWKTASETLSVQAKDKGGKEYASISDYYGVNAIPTMVLVGKDGKVLDTHARGEHLKKLLEEQFPDVK